MYVIQITFVVTLLVFEKFDLGYKDNQYSTPISFCLFFTALILHWQCLNDARNGIYMMKYAICKHHEFTQPITAFLLGFFQLSGIWLAQSCSMLKQFDQKSPKDVIVRFVGFALITSVPKLIVSTMDIGLDVQKSVGKLTLEESRKTTIAKQDTIPFCFGLNLIYCFHKWFYVSFYYYFFPMIVIFAPLFKITYLYDIQLN